MTRNEMNFPRGSHLYYCRRHSSTSSINPTSTIFRVSSRTRRYTSKTSNNYQRSPVDGGGCGGNDPVRVVSARKLAAGLWRLKLVGVPANGAGGESSSSPSPLGGNEKPSKSKCGSPHGLRLPSELDSPLVYPNSMMEGATKWDLVFSRISNGVTCIYSNLKLLENQFNTVPATSAIQAEAMKAQVRIHELEAERNSFRKKVEHLLRRLEEEKISRKCRQSWKVRTVIGDLGNELKRERKTRERLERSNFKLVNELQNVKSLAERHRQDYEEEKKSRELMEEVCNELANRASRDKASFDTLKMESVKIQEELEAERKMLQMAEVWREERVQMKLLDVKLAVEDKYGQMNILIKELENLLSSGKSSLTLLELRKAEMIRQAAKSIKADIGKFSYEPPESSDMYSLLEEIKEIEANYWAVEPPSKQSPGSNVSRIPTSSLTNNSSSAQISEVCSESAEKSLQKVSCLSKHLRSGLNNDRHDRKTSNAGDGSRFSNSTICSMDTPCPNGKSCKSRLQVKELTRRPDVWNRHVTKGVEGSFEWPQDIQKNSLKAKLLEARLESQKAKLCNGIKQES